MLSLGMSKTGLVLCGIYAALIACCVGYALLGGVDDNSRFIFMQIPIALQAALAAKLELSQILTDVSWSTAYLIFAVPVFALLYGIGVLRDAVGSH